MSFGSKIRLINVIVLSMISNNTVIYWIRTFTYNLASLKTHSELSLPLATRSEKTTADFFSISHRILKLVLYA